MIANYASYRFVCRLTTLCGGLLLALLCTATLAQESELPNPFDFLPAGSADSDPPVAVENSPPAKTPVPEEEPSPKPSLDEPPPAAAAEVPPAEDGVNPLREASEAPPLRPRDALEPGEAQPADANERPVAEPIVAARGQGVGRGVRQGPAGDAVLQAEYKKAMLIDVEGPIFGRFAWYLNNRLDLAERQQVDLVILRLTSPGGDLEYSLQLARRLRDIRWATTVVFVPEEAISGGAIIALGCDRIYMQQGALIGDAGPIRLGLGGQFEHAEEKVVSYLAGAVRELAKSKHRPAALAEAMVDRSLVVFEAVDIATGEKVFLTQKELDDPAIAARVRVGQQVAESGRNRFLTVGAQRAAELQLSEGVFASEQELVQQLKLDKLQITRMTWVDRTVYLLNRPWLTALLLIVGLLGLYMELIAPGISVAGLTSLFCFSLFFWSHALGGTAGWLEVLLFGLGVTCVLFELFVVPGFGVFGISGIVLVVFSLVMASQNFVVPDTATEWSQLRTNLLIVLGSVLGVLILFFGQILLLDSIPGMNRFRLSAPAAGEGTDNGVSLTSLTQSPLLAQQPLSPGDTGRAESDLRPSGKISVGDRLVDVISEGDYVDVGSTVEVLRVEGNRVIVRKC